MNEKKLPGGSYSIVIEEEDGDCELYTMLDVIQRAFQELGGVVGLYDIYSAVERITGAPLDDETRLEIRETVERNTASGARSAGLFRHPPGNDLNIWRAAAKNEINETGPRKKREP